MAIINQSPAGQTSLAISGIQFDDIAASGTEPLRRGFKIASSPSVAAIFGGEIGAAICPVNPTSGQVWPLGVLY